MREETPYDRLQRRAVDAICSGLERMHRFLGRLAVRGIGASLRALGRVPWPGRFAILLGVCALACLGTGLRAEKWIVESMELGRAHMDALKEHGILGAFRRFADLMLAVVPIYVLIAAFAALVRRRMALFLLKVAAVSFFCLWGYWLYFISRAPAVLLKAEADGFDMYARNELLIRGLTVWFPFFVVALVLLWLVVLKDVAVYYRAPPPGEAPLLGDRIVENLRTHGGDERFRTSTYWAVTVHALAIIVPMIATRGCMMAPYAVPKGRGEQMVQRIVVKRIKKKKKKKYVLNMNSPIVYYVPDLDDSDVLEKLEEETQDTYQATKMANLGKGGKGKGGWPHGMENARVRFIRLRYSGGDWDQDMGLGADYNLLIQFHKLTGFKIAPRTEAIKVSDLARFPRHRAPPFVFITGRQNINVSSRDVKTLRHYCLVEGGMLFADNGGGHFNNSFRRLMARTFPDKRWIDIADDDIIFQRP
ncbi:MAG: DUF4159 domain-containing protein, partial [Planctomycetota bacterium]